MNNGPITNQHVGTTSDTALENGVDMPIVLDEAPEQKRNLGFTLIELSIVLVIIGLIVGGILVGQDLIAAARIRATVGQIEKYNSAVNTFQTKFNGIPGDLLSTTASGFGLSTLAGTTGRGDGNGLIDGIIAGASSQAAWTQEGGALWVHLSQANLVDGTFSESLDGTSPIAVPAASVSMTWPLAKIGRGNYINAGSASGINYWVVTGITAGLTTGGLNAYGALTPIEAYNMDIKLDDGNPLTGVVQTHGTSANGASTGSLTLFTDAPSAASASTTGDCLAGDTAGTATTDTYNRSITAGGTTPTCILRFRFN